MDENDVLEFWFNQLKPSDWYKKDSNLDKEITEKFLDLYHRAVRGELFLWRNSIKGRLAEIIVLDQFSRNIFRDNAKAFQYDCLALTLSQEASRSDSVGELSLTERSFLYMPFMHSESSIIHEEAIKYFSIPGLENNLEFEIKHKAIIDKFGRYPHRNETLGRKSTVEEIEFLKSPGSSF